MKRYTAISSYKTADEDVFTEGCIGNPTCVMCESIHITGDSLTSLINQLAKAYYLHSEPEYWNIREMESDGSFILEMNQLEDGDGNQINEGMPHYNNWKAGKVKAWLCDYSFACKVEETSPAPITSDEITSAGIRNE